MAQSSIFTGSVSTLHDSTKLIRCPTYPHGAIVNSVPRLRRCDPILTEKYAAKSNKRSYRLSSNIKLTISLMITDTVYIVSSQVL